MTRQEIATEVARHFSFFQGQCRLFCEWMDEYAVALRDGSREGPPRLDPHSKEYKRQWKEFKRAEKEFNEGKRERKPCWSDVILKDYMTASQGDDYCLTFKSGNWRLVSLVHPLGYFGLPATVVPRGDVRNLTEAKRRLCDCVLLSFVYALEVRSSGTTSDPDIFPAYPRDNFDLMKFWWALREQLETSAGEGMIQRAWVRVKAHLDELVEKPNGPGRAGETVGGAPHGVAKPETGSVRDRVFISYSRKDKKWLDELQGHLEPYRRKGLVTVWSDESIPPGEKWFAEIRDALALTKVAVLLVTSDFLASEFIAEHELKPLLEQEREGEVRIIWIPVGACSYKETELKNLQAPVDPDKPLANMKKPDRNRIWVKVCKAIKEAASC